MTDALERNRDQEADAGHAVPEALPRLIEFELRAADMRAFETWGGLKLLASGSAFKVLVLVAPVVGFVIGLRYPRLLPFAEDVNVLLLAFVPQWSLIAAFLAIKRWTLWRYRRAAGLVEGRHSTHFSAAGIHHVGPLGTRRHAWSGLRDIELTVDYVFFRFADDGSVAVPIAALRKAFGELEGMPDELFLQDIVPLITAETAS
jgi:hypothetical protein